MPPVRCHRSRRADPLQARPVSLLGRARIALRCREDMRIRFIRARNRQHCCHGGVGSYHLGDHRELPRSAIRPTFSDRTLDYDVIPPPRTVI